MNPALTRDPVRRGARQPPGPARGRKRGRRAGAGPGRRPWLGLLYLAPGIIAYAVVVIVPVGQGVWLSFFNWNGVTAATWAGLSTTRASCATRSCARRSSTRCTSSSSSRCCRSPSGC